MKKITSMLLALMLLVSCLGIAAQAEQIYYGVDGDPIPVVTPETEPETQPYVPPVETQPAETQPVYTPPVVTVQPENQAGWYPETQPITWDPPTEPTTSNLVPVITKDPYGETVAEGEYAEFVARADNSSGIIWHLVSPTGGSDVLCSDASNTFSGLRVEGLNTERLILRNIPKALDGWKVRAEFVGWEKNVMSADAVIHVTAVELKTPIITENPMSVNLQPNEGTVLRANAYLDGGATLTYQWYQSSFNSNSGGMAIAGATSSTYTPDYTSGTMYYYCAIRATNGNQFSEAVKTSCAAVTYAAMVTQPATVPTMAPPPTTQPTEATTEYQRPTDETISWTTPTTEPERMPQTTAKTGNSGSLMMIIVAVILLIAVIGILATVLILKFYPNGDDDDEEYENPLPRKPVNRAAYEQAKRDYEAALRRQAALKQAQRAAQQPRPTAQQSRPAAPKQQPTVHKYERPAEPPKEPVIDWDDLSDLGDLSIYFEDENK